MKIFTTVRVNDNINIEVWSNEEELFVSISKKNTKVFFSKLLWTHLISYCDDKFKKNEKGFEHFGKKKEIEVSEVVKITTKDTPVKEVTLDKNEWCDVMKVHAKVKDILEKKEGHYNLSENTVVHARKPSENINIWAIFEKTNVKGGLKLYMSDKALKELCTQINAINMCLNDNIEEKFKLESMTFAQVIKVDTGKLYVSLVRQDNYGVAKRVFNLTELEWVELIKCIEDILEVIQPNLLYGWHYTFQGQGNILSVSDRSFVNEDACRTHAECNVPSYDSWDGPNSLTHELHIDTLAFPEYSCQFFIPRFKWKHVLGNITTCTDACWYMYKESCRRKALHAQCCFGSEKLIINEQAGKSNVIDLKKHVINDLKYNPLAPLITYLFLLERLVTQHMNPNEDWDDALRNYLPVARCEISIENLMYACNILSIPCSTLDATSIVTREEEVNLKENEVLEHYRVMIKNMLDFELTYGSLCILE